MFTHPVILFLFLTVFWACSSGDARSAQASGKLSHASTASKPSPPRSPSTGACPLSLAQQVEAVQRFEELMPVIQHPRCANCHGGIDFFSPGYEEIHGGGAVEMEKAQVKGPDGKVIADHRPNFRTCQNCHDAAPGDFAWLFPHPDENINFAGRTAGEICEGMKRHEPSPNSLMGHMKEDDLIRLGFEGRRGHTSLDPKPPPATRDAFISKAGAWVKSLNVEYVSEDNVWKGKWPQPLSCGCVAPDVLYQITVHSRTQTENYGEIGNVFYSAELQADPTDSTQLIGTGRYSGSVISRKLNCHSSEPERKRTHVVTGNLEASGGLAEFPGEGNHFMYLLATTDWPLLPFGTADELEPSDPEMKEAAKGLGTVSGPFLGVPLQGKVTKTQNQREGDFFEKTDCSGNITTTEEITITDLSTESTGGAGR